MTTELPYDVLAGIPEPGLSRWQPLRAGILNLFRYDEQTFVFHRGRLLLRGNNGTGKSMALEVLLPYVLDADLSPSRLSVFGGRDRSMYLWLLGHDKSGERGSVRAYVWVEFGRRLPDGAAVFFTAGAMLEATRGGDVKPHYFTTAARIGLDFSVGAPGSEPLNKKALADVLAAHDADGRPGKIHPDANAHRTAVNNALYGLPKRQFDALRNTLLQLRRPKLSDKLDVNGLDAVLRNSLPAISDTTVADLAEGFERLDRHADAVDELIETINHLRTLFGGYRRYARVAGVARADAVVAAESTVVAVGGQAAAAKVAFAAAEADLADIRARLRAIGERNAEIRGRWRALTELEAYRKGQDLGPLRELVASLDKTVRTATEAARRLRLTAGNDAASSERATADAVQARDAYADDRTRAYEAAAAAFATTLDEMLTTRVTDLVRRDIDDEAMLSGTLAEARVLLADLAAGLRPWEDEVRALVELDVAARKGAAETAAARRETERAEVEVGAAEGRLNACLAEDNRAVLAWVDEVTAWTQASTELRAGQAPPLPWEAATVLDRASRWAAEARAARTKQLVAEHARLTTAATQRDTAAAAARSAAGHLEDLAAALHAAATVAGRYQATLAAYRDALGTWAGTLVELRAGLAVPDWAAVRLDTLPAFAAAWAERAATARTNVLTVEKTELGHLIGDAVAGVDILAAREDRLSRSELPELGMPPTRQASRDGRPGAPLYLLVDFVPTLPDWERLGLEAATVASGLADAWVNPDGRLLDGSDGGPLLDTQLHAVGPAPAPEGSLAGVLVADPGCARHGVSPDVVEALLSHIRYADTAATAASDTGILLGRDGSWRAGTLTGAHRIPALTLIGATNRENARIAALAAVRVELAAARRELGRLRGRDDELAAALQRAEGERASVPDDAEVRSMRESARDAAAAVTAALPGTADGVAEAAAGPASDGGGDETAREAGSELAARWAPVGEQLAEAPADDRLVEPLRLLAADAGRLAQDWERARDARRGAAEECLARVTTADAEESALPNPAAVHQARAKLEAARRVYADAVERFTRRQEEENEAAARALAGAEALHAAVLGAGLPAGCDVGGLAGAVQIYRDHAEQWLRSAVEVVRATGNATIAVARTLASGEAADEAAADADERTQEHLEQKATLEALTESYGTDYTSIVAELGDLDRESGELGREHDRLGTAENAQIEKKAKAEADGDTAERDREAAERVRGEADAAFLAAVRIGVFTAAGLPDSPPRPDAGSGDAVPTGLDALDFDPAELDVRALLDWARAVREAAGDRRRDAPAVEQASNKVKQIRYELEPSLAGRVTIRDEDRDGLLILHASRGTQTTPLPAMLKILDGDLRRDQSLLAQHEADLFRRFLADATRREVTTKVRDARTTIKAMADLMASHPTGSGIQVRLRWVSDDRDAPGMHEIVTLMAKEAPLDSEKDRLRDFFRTRVAQVRANADTDYKAQMAALLDYRQWWRFQVDYRRGPSSRSAGTTNGTAGRAASDTGGDGWERLTTKSHGTLSTGEKAVCLHLPLFAAAATYCNSAGIRASRPDGRDSSAAPRLILLDEVFAGVDEDNRGDLFDIIRCLELDLVATSESEQGFYAQLDGLAVYQLVASDQLDAVFAARTVWDGRVAHRVLDDDLSVADLGDSDLFSAL
jgi:hypothetical protein